ncbi:MAG: 5-formyltetrahydrofolate cyclo-ligase [Oligoflexia bacterium]
MAKATSRPSELRRRLQSWRKGLSHDERQAFSRAIDARLLSGFLAHPEWTEPRQGQPVIWGGYCPLPWEWDLSGVYPFLKQRGVLLAFPRTIFDTHQISWHLADPAEVDHWGNHFRFSSLKEPHSHLPRVDPSHLYGVIVPGVAFSIQGERMGTGGGFYDRFFSDHPQIVRVAVAAEAQVFSELSGQRPDEPRMHWLFSDQRELKFAQPG